MNDLYPSGFTPLTKHLKYIKEHVEQILPTLSEGQHVSITIATDGLPSDDLGASGRKEKEEFVQLLRSMLEVPVFVVIRLCSKEKEIVEFYQDLNSQLEMPIDLLRDFATEAAKVERNNRYINYFHSLHRCREMGFNHRLLDIINIRSLTVEEVGDFMRVLFSLEKEVNLDPETDWNEFVKAISKLAKSEKKQWNPISSRKKRVINVMQLKMQYSKNRNLNRISNALYSVKMFNAPRISRT